MLAGGKNGQQTRAGPYAPWILGDLPRFPWGDCMIELLPQATLKFLPVFTDHHVLQAWNDLEPIIINQCAGTKIFSPSTSQDANVKTLRFMCPRVGCDSMDLHEAF